MKTLLSVLFLGGLVSAVSAQAGEFKAFGNNAKDLLNSFKDAQAVPAFELPHLVQYSVENVSCTSSPDYSCTFQQTLPGPGNSEVMRKVTHTMSGDSAKILTHSLGKALRLAETPNSVTAKSVFCSEMETHPLYFYTTFSCSIVTD